MRADLAPSSRLDPLVRLPLRVAMRGLHAVMKLRWRFTRPRVRGAHAFVLTREGRIVLVRLRYADGWRFPGGGVGPDEEPTDALLRELREEIGLTAHQDVRLAFEEEMEIDWKRDRSSIFIVTGATCSPRWSFEIEAIAEYRPDALPHDLSPRTARWLARLLPGLG